jgi:hypothetical protein
MLRVGHFESEGATTAGRATMLWRLRVVTIDRFGLLFTHCPKNYTDGLPESH